MSVVRLHTHTNMTSLDKIKEGSRKIDAIVQKRLSRFPGLRNTLVSTFSNPDFQGQTVPLTGPLGQSSWREGREEKEGDDSRQDDQGTARGGWVISLFFFSPPRLPFLPR